MKKVRDEMGLTNLKLMIPFCRTVEEGRKVHSRDGEARTQARRRRAGDLRHVRNPQQRHPGREFAEIFDGFCIGSNDLTQLILGVDRDSEIVAPIFDERNAAVKKMIAQVIAGLPREEAARSASAARRRAIIRTSRNSWSSKASTAFRSIPTPC